MKFNQFEAHQTETRVIQIIRHIVTKWHSFPNFQKKKKEEKYIPNAFPCSKWRFGFELHTHPTFVIRFDTEQNHILLMYQNQSWRSDQCFTITRKFNPNWPVNRGLIGQIALAMAFILWKLQSKHLSTKFSFNSLTNNRKIKKTPSQ